jgi:hypothetical protein
MQADEAATSIAHVSHAMIFVAMGDNLIRSSAHP